MNGDQKTAWEAVTEIAQKIKDGTYGTDDALDVEALETDLADVTAAIG